MIILKNLENINVIIYSQIKPKYLFQNFYLFLEVEISYQIILSLPNKLIFTLVAAFLIAVTPCFEDNKMLKPNLKLTKNIMIILYVIWQLFDGIMILYNKYVNSNAVEMISEQS